MSSVTADGAAALRLGASFDPAFLQQAGIGRVGGDDVASGSAGDDVAGLGPAVLIARLLGLCVRAVLLRRLSRGLGRRASAQRRT